MKAIDVHAHVGVYSFSSCGIINRLMTAGPQEVAERGLGCDIRWTIVSSTIALGAERGCVTVGNAEARAAAERHPCILFWAVHNPLDPDSAPDVRALLSHPKCAGIKVHPTLHGYDIKERGEEVFSLAAEVSRPLLTHSGCERALPEDFVPFADRFPEARLILAHLGHCADERPDHQVRAIQQSRAGNIWTDTSSIKSHYGRLIEWAVGEIGADRMLFGSDSPLYFAASAKSRVEGAGISEQDKKKILWDNAVALLGLAGRGFFEEG